jgi:hypothetical protein
VLRKRPYIAEELVEQAVERPARRLEQGDGRIRLWGWVTDPRDGEIRALRVILLEDGETLHNAFYDRDFTEAEP